MLSIKNKLHSFYSSIHQKNLNWEKYRYEGKFCKIFTFDKQECLFLADFLGLVQCLLARWGRLQIKKPILKLPRCYQLKICSILFIRVSIKKNLNWKKYRYEGKFCKIFTFDKQECLFFADFLGLVQCFLARWGR